MAIFSKIGECLVGIFAWVMKTILPASVLIEKNWGMPRAKAQVRYLHEHHELCVDIKFLRARNWHIAAMRYLIKNGYYALVDQITPDKENPEFQYLIGARPMNTFSGSVSDSRYKKAVMSLLKGKTPNNETISWLKMNNIELFIYLLDNCPQIFNGLSYEEVREIEGTDRLFPLDSWMSSKDVAIARLWAERVFSAILNKDKEEITEDERKLIEQSVPVLLKDEFDFSTYMEKLIEFNFDTEPIRQRYDGNCPYSFGKKVSDWYAHGVSVICAVLPKVWGRSDAWEKTAWKWRYDNTVQAALLDVLPKNDLESFEKVADLVDSYEVAAKALGWLTSSYRRNEQKAMSIWNMMLNVQARSAGNGWEIKSIMERLPTGDSWIPVLRLRMVEKVSGADDTALMEFFPFSDWEKETAEEAIRKLFKLDRFPVSKIAELSEDLQSVAREEQEIASEIKALTNHMSDELIAHKLHGRSESYLLTHNLAYATDWLDEKLWPWKYCLNNRLEDEAFAAMLKAGYRIDVAAPFIRRYAKKWGLTPNNYYDLLASYMSYLGPIVRDFVLTPEQMAIEAAEKEAEEAKKVANDAFEAAKIDASVAVEAIHVAEAEAGEKADAAAAAEA